MVASPTTSVSSTSAGHSNSSSLIAGRAFRRSLSIEERIQVEVLLQPSSRSKLDQAVRSEFDWVVTTGSRVPGAPGRVDYSGAITALRQLTYLNGLPALDSDVVSELLKFHTTCDRLGQDLSYEEFHSAYIHLLKAAVGDGANCP